MPDAPVELNAVVRSAVEPVRVVTAAALIWPLVLVSRVLRSAAASVTSESVTASLPRPEMPVAPVELNVVVRSAVEPVSVVTVPALIWPLVLVSRVLRAAAARVVSESMTASLPSPVIPLESKAEVTAAAVPVRVPTEAALTATVVFPSRVFRAAALTDESVTEIE